MSLPKGQVRGPIFASICKHPGCDGAANYSGFCRMHYERQKKLLDPERKDLNIRRCESPGCNQFHFAKGMCKFHYRKSQYQKDKAKKLEQSNAI